MTDRVAIMGSSGAVSGPAGLSTSDLMRAVGNNCGNLLFQHAARNLIKNDCFIVDQRLERLPSEVKRAAKVLVLPAANFIRSDLDLTHLTAFIEVVDRPLVVLGLGAQANGYDDPDTAFHSSVARFVDVIAERAETISVRGAFTAAVLAEYGAHNVAVTGCPSNFVSENPTLGQSIAAKHARRLSSFVTHAEEPWPSTAAKSDVGRRLAAWAHAGPAFMVQQSVPLMIGYLRRANGVEGSTAAEHEHLGESLRQAFLPNISAAAFEAFLVSKVRTYYSVDQWMEDSGKVGFSVGMRLHGNMAAWQAGTPALWIHHDARTRELVETMALPHMSVAQFLDTCPTIDAARESWTFDADAYDAQRRTLRDTFDTVLRAGGLTPVSPPPPAASPADAQAPVGSAAPPPAEAGAPHPVAAADAA